MALPNLLVDDRISWGGSMQLRSAHRRLAPYLVIAASSCLSPQIVAQTTTSGALMGVITDQTKAVVASAQVDIKDMAKGTT